MIDRRSCSAAGALPILLLLAAGCSSTRTIPAPQVELEPPPSWSDAIESASLETTEVPGVGAAWWQHFGDPRLDRLVEQALGANPDLRAAAANVEAALALARIEGAALEPQVGTSLGTSRRKQTFIGLPIPGSEGRVLSTTSTNSNLSLSVSWEADLWGRLRAQKAAAYAEATASEADLEAARLSLAGQVSKAWFALTEAHQQVELSESTLDSRRRTERQVRSRYERGVAPPLDLRLVRTQIGSVEAQLAQQQQGLDLARRQLELLLGGYPAGELVVANALPPVPEPVPTGIPAELVSRRPDLHAAERRAWAASADLRAARRALYPSLSLTGSSGTASQDLDDLLDGDFSVWSLAASLLQPLFQGGRLRAGVDLAEAGLDASVAAWLGATLRAFFEVESALAAEHWLDQRVAALELTADESRAAERLAFDRYTSGLGDYLSVLDSQRSTFAAESLLLAARRQRLDARIDLILALGGGTSSPQPDAPAEETPPRTTEASR